MKKSRQFSLLFSSLLLFFGGNMLQAQTPSWNTIRSGDYHYEIQFPAIPQEVFKNVPEGLKITTYAPFGQGTFFTKLLIFNHAVKNPTETVTKTVQSLATKMNGKVTQEEEWKLGEEVGIMTQIVIPEAGEGKPEMSILCNVIVVGKIQYQIMVMAPSGTMDAGVTNVFFSSFNLL